jgi:RNA polymerase sigma-70 factor (ECF subfamily)
VYSAQEQGCDTPGNLLESTRASKPENFQFATRIDKIRRRERHRFKRMPEPIDIERLYDEHAQALFSFALSFTGQEADGRDLLQDVFVKLARQPEILDGVRDERAFLLRLAHNRAIDLLRRREARKTRHAALAAESTSLFSPAADPDARAFQEALSSALEELPQEQRVVVHLKLWQGFTFERIAAVLDIPTNTAGSRYRYGLDKLRERLRPLYEEVK